MSVVDHWVAIQFACLRHENCLHSRGLCTQRTDRVTDNAANDAFSERLARGRRGAGVLLAELCQVLSRQRHHRSVSAPGKPNNAQSGSPRLTEIRKRRCSIGICPTILLMSSSRASSNPSSRYGPLGHALETAGVFRRDVQPHRREDLRHRPVVTD